MLKKLLQRLAHLSLSKELSLALGILNLLSQLPGPMRGIGLARLVYTALPDSWKAPSGPATEDEFLDAIQSGHVFLGKVKLLVNG